jgi:hypothetical protein
MNSTRHGIGAMALIGVLTLTPVTHVIGQGIQPCVHEARFGLAGMARLQTARLNVVNLLPPNPFQPPDPAHPPDPLTPPDPCRIAIGFLHPGGDPFVDAAGVPIIVERDLRPGEFAVLELQSPDAFRDSRSLRTTVRPTAFLRHAPVAADAPEPCGAVVPTLEIYEPLTGRTQVFSHPSEIFEFNPQPEPPGEISPGGN